MKRIMKWSLRKDEKEEDLARYEEYKKKLENEGEVILSEEINDKQIIFELKNV